MLFFCGQEKITCYKNSQKENTISYNDFILFEWELLTSVGTSTYSLGKKN